MDSRFDPCCIVYWFPRIAAAGLPVPETHWTRTPNALDLLKALDGELPVTLAPLAETLRRLAEPLGYPCFLRTGHTSGKHDWNRCCYVTAPERFEQHIVNLVEMSELCGMFGELPYDVWAVREILPTRPLFRCERYGGFPVVREFRFFVDGGEYLYHQPYWPEDALAEGGPDDRRWRDRLEELHRLDGNDLAETRSLAKSAGLALGGRWSVDILDTDRGWYITDMALAERSWGWRPIIRARVA